MRGGNIRVRRHGNTVLNRKRRDRYAEQVQHDRSGKKKAHRLDPPAAEEGSPLKTYDVHTVYEYVHRIEANSAHEAKGIAETSVQAEGEQISGPDVVAVLEVTDGVV